MTTHEDFKRSDRFLLGTARDTWNGDIAYRWLENGKALAYRHQDANRTEFRRIDTRTGHVAPLFDHAVMGEILSGVLEKKVEAERLPIDAITAIDGQTYTLTSGGKTIVCDLSKREARVQDDAKSSAPPPSLAPAGGREVHLRDYNLWLKNPDSSEKAITTDGVVHNAYGAGPESSTHVILAQRMGLKEPPAVIWSADGRRFVYHRLDERHVPELHLLQAVPDDGSYRPKLHTYRYELVGEKGAVTEHFVYDVETGKSVQIDYRPIGATLAAAIAAGRVWWSQSGDKVYLLDISAQKRRMRLVEADTKTDAARVLVEETGDGSQLPGWLMFLPPAVRTLRNGDVIWFSERSGWGHLYLYDGKTGSLKNAITSGEWLVRDILHIDEDAGQIYFTASGREAGDNVYSVKAYRASLDGKKIERLTPEPGMHMFFVTAPAVQLVMPRNIVPSFAPDGSCFVDRVGGADSLATWVLRDRDGKKIAELAREDASPLPPFTMPEPFTVKSADGQWDLHGVLLKPADFDPSKSYPVIDNIYPGPQVTRTPASFSGGSIFGAAIFGDAQALADLGFVVMLFDGRGNLGRSKPHRDISYGNMNTAGSLEDHVAALRQLATDRPYLDLDRVGIFGSSGGGFATGHALTQFPDFFKVGVAGCGNFENRAYLGTWGETYHGLQDETDYDKVFPGKLASQLKGKLLLAHGDMDDNVHPANTMRLADAFIKAGKQFDMLMMPNVHHGIGGDAYFRRYQQNYFLKHLMGAALPDEPNIVPAGGYAKEG